MKGRVDEYLELSCPCHPSQLHLFDYHFTRHVYIYICMYIYTAFYMHMTVHELRNMFIGDEP